MAMSVEEKRRRLAANREKALARRRNLVSGKVTSAPANITSAPNDTLNSSSDVKKEAAQEATTATSKRNAAIHRTLPKMIHRKDYIQYDIAHTKDSRGGFLEEPKNQKTLEQWKEQQGPKTYREPAPPVDIVNAPRCYECNTIEINQEYYDVYKCRVCNKCREKFPEKYALLTKTECKQDYFMTESELMDTTLFSHIEKPNPHAKFSRMMLYLRYQIEEYAFKKWGGADGLDQEWLRREKYKMDKKTRLFESRLKEMRKRTRAEEFTRKMRKKGRDYGHVHEWIEISREGDMVRKKCNGCGVVLDEEEF